MRDGQNGPRDTYPAVHGGDSHLRQLWAQFDLYMQLQSKPVGSLRVLCVQLAVVQDFTGVWQPKLHE